jgi:hypothetical protein
MELLLGLGLMVLGTVLIVLGLTNYKYNDCNCEERDDV